MARLQHSAQIESKRSAKESRERVLAYFASIGARMLTVSDDYLEARTGSQVGTRVKGGMIARPSEFPMRTLIVIRSIEGGSSLDVTVVDDLGFGFKVGMKNKYQRGFEERVADVSAAIA